VADAIICPENLPPLARTVLTFRGAVARRDETPQRLFPFEGCRVAFFTLVRGLLPGGLRLVRAEDC
jgi:hypothetical protein